MKGCDVVLGSVEVLQQKFEGCKAIFDTKSHVQVKNDFKILSQVICHNYIPREN